MSAREWTIHFCLPLECHKQLFLLLTFSFFKASAYGNLNFGIPYTFLVLLDTFYNILQFFDNSKIFLSFRSVFQKHLNFQKNFKSLIFFQIFKKKIQKIRIFKNFQTFKFFRFSNYPPSNSPHLDLPKGKAFVKPYFYLFRAGMGLELWT